MQKVYIYIKLISSLTLCIYSCDPMSSSVRGNCGDGALCGVALSGKIRLNSSRSRQCLTRILINSTKLGFWIHFCISGNSKWEITIFHGAALDMLEKFERFLSSGLYLVLNRTRMKNASSLDIWLDTSNPNDMWCKLTFPTLNIHNQL